MKLALVYEPNDRKLSPVSCSYIYKGMFDALKKRFLGHVQDVTHSCSAQDIEADLIFFFDVHSSHDIEIEGVKNHKAVKMEYWSDPHQEEIYGTYKQTGTTIHKRGPRQRVERVINRGVDFIVSPVRDGFLKYMKPLLGADAEKLLLWFPPAPSFEAKDIPLKDRKPEVLANGATWAGDLKCYEFRKWAFAQPCVSFVGHCLQDSGTPNGQHYSDLLYNFAGGLALSEYYPVPKYYEMPLAGMVTFVQWHDEMYDLGFRNFENCISVHEPNFKAQIESFINNLESYQHIASAGQKLVKENYTAEKFAERIYEEARR